MIILEFIIFVVSSGLFCSEKFRGHVWAVIVAGAIATGSSLLFVYDLGAKLTGHEKQPPVVTKFIDRTVVKTVGASKPPATAGKAHSCLQNYPVESLNKHEEGTTTLAFRILTDGTVDAVKVLTSSGSELLDEAAIKCATDWHYRPAIKDGQITETDWRANVRWVLPTASQAKAETPAPAAEADKPAQESAPPAPKDESKESHPWYDVGSWFSSEPEKKPQ
jgi:TonB family protein